MGTSKDIKVEATANGRSSTSPTKRRLATSDYEQTPPPSSARHNPLSDASPTPRSNRRPKNSLKNRPATVFVAVYSNVPVYEMMVRGIGVMKRKKDGYMNATQILKLAGIDKTKRTKILERYISNDTGLYEKVQGGYGRYQGTWIPLDRAKEFAKQYGVYDHLLPLIDHDPLPKDNDDAGSGGESAPEESSLSPPEDIHNNNNNHNHNTESMMDVDPSSSISHKRPRESLDTSISQAKRAKVKDERVKNDAEDSEVAMVDEDGGEPAAETETEADIAAELEMIDSRSHFLNNRRNSLHRTQSEGAEDSSKFHKATKFTDALGDNPVTSETHRNILMQIFMTDTESISTQNKNNGEDVANDGDDNEIVFPEGLDLNTPIDEHLHTALHWAAALARISLVRSLVSKGADIHRGNKAGETALSRAVLVTNCYQHTCFPDLLEILAPTLRTADSSHRTILHHIALSAGVRGRSVNSLYYLECVLEYIARNEGGQFSSLVNAQDINGDTAFNIIARVGNRGMVRMLVDVGADPFIPNKLGLRPCDFGFDEDLNISPGDRAIGLLKHDVSSFKTTQPHDSSESIVHKLQNIVEDLQQQFSIEIKQKNETYETLQTQLRESARGLAGQRKELQALRNQCTELEKAKQRVRNLELALVEEDGIDWSRGQPMKEIHFAASTGTGPTKDITMDRDDEVYMDSDSSKKACIDPDEGGKSLLDGSNLETFLPVSIVEKYGKALGLHRLAKWYRQTCGMLEERIDKTRGANAELHTRCQRIVAICCNVPTEEIDGMIEQLVVALESDGKDLDITRVAAFIAKQKEATTTTATAAKGIS